MDISKFDNSFLLKRAVFLETYKGVHFYIKKNKIGKRNVGTDMVKTVQLKDRIVPYNVFCTSNDIETIYNRIVDHSKVHNYNVSDVQFAMVK